MNRPARALGAASLALGAGLALALLAPLEATAHVTLDENTAEAGSYTVITFKVPNESGTAATTSLTISLPTDTPFTSVRYIPVAGWAAELVRTELPTPVTIGETEVTEAVTSVVWTATGTGIRDGELQLFSLSVGPVPDVGSVALPVDQGYDDGTVVPWAGDDAPVLFVNDAPEGDHHGGEADEGHGEDVGGGTGNEGDAETAVAGATDPVSRVLAGAGVVLGGSALVVALARRRSRAPAS